jgi:DNA-binding protein YbaB
MGIFDNVSKLNEIRKLQNELNKREFTASSKDGRVKVTVNGNLAMTKVELDPEIYTLLKVEQLQKSIAEVGNRALSEAKAAMQKSTQQMAKDMGINLPGM